MGVTGVMAMLYVKPLLAHALQREWALASPFWRVKEPPP